jgi:type IV secretory pathway ATPase VirB11/archaellum biosynthesis ATPase
MGKSTISMAIETIVMLVYQRVTNKNLGISPTMQDETEQLVSGLSQQLDSGEPWVIRGYTS